MMKLHERLPEFPVTEWEGVRIRIIVNHPKAEASMTYEVFHDERLMPLTPIRRPVDGDQWSFIEYSRQMAERQDLIRMLSEQISAAVCHALRRVEGE